MRDGLHLTGKGAGVFLQTTAGNYKFDGGIVG